MILTIKFCILGKQGKCFSLFSHLTKCGMEFYLSVGPVLV